MTRGDEQSPDPFWEYAEPLDGTGRMIGAMEYGEAPVRGEYFHVCPLCGGLARSRDHRYCQGCGKSRMAGQIREIVRRAREKRLRREGEAT